MTLVAGAVVAYLVGAIPVGFLIARAFGIGDIRRHGSGGIGMTNVLRTAGKAPAILTLLGDALKGAVAVAAGSAAATAAGGVPGDPVAPAVAAAAAVVGNCWSVFLGFRGGKGVATGLGAMLCLVPLAVLPAAIVFLAVVATTRYVSLGSLLGALGVPAVALVLALARGVYPLASVAAAAVVALVIVVRHHENIARLRSGTENRIGQRVKAA